MIAALLIGLSTVLLKKSLLKKSFRNSLKTTWFWAGLFTGLLGGIIFTFDLQVTAISTAVPMLAQSYIVIVPLSAFWLKEKIGSRELLGVSLIVVGAMLL